MKGRCEPESSIFSLAVGVIIADGFKILISFGLPVGVRASSRYFYGSFVCFTAQNLFL